MKKSLGLIALVGCFALLFSGVATAANVNSAMRIEVPFAFIAGDYTLPAGEYFVEMQRLNIGSALGSSLVLTRTDDNARFLVRALPAPTGLFRPEAKMIFHKYGAQYFLTNVESYGHKSQLFRSKAENELMARYSTSPETISVATD